MEQTVYMRQNQKRATAHRIIDFKNIAASTSEAELSELYSTKKLPQKNAEFVDGSGLTDDLLKNVLQWSEENEEKVVNGVDSHGGNMEMDTELTEQEKQRAWAEYKQKSKKPERPDIFAIRKPTVSSASPGQKELRTRKLEIPTDDVQPVGKKKRPEVPELFHDGDLTMYGFDKNIYPNVLATMVEEKYGRTNQTWNQHIPDLLLQLHEQMEKGDKTVSVR